MAKTIEQLKAQGAEVKNATVVGENTATRVGTLFTDIVEHVEQYEARQTADTEANAKAIAEEKAAIMANERIADGAVTIEKIADSSIDDESKAGSDNLVKSGGLYNQISRKVDCLQGKYLGNFYNHDTDLVGWDINSTTGQLIQGGGGAEYSVSDKIYMDFSRPVKMRNFSYPYAYCFDENDKYLGQVRGLDNPTILTDTYPTVFYIRAFLKNNNRNSATLQYSLNDTSFYLPYNSIGGYYDIRHQNLGSIFYGSIAYDSINNKIKITSKADKSNIVIVCKNGEQINTGIAKNSEISTIRNSYFIIAYKRSTDEFVTLVDYTGDWTDYVLFAQIDHLRVMWSSTRIIINKNSFEGLKFGYFYKGTYLDIDTNNNKIILHNNPSNLSYILCTDGTGFNTGLADLSEFSINPDYIKLYFTIAYDVITNTIVGLQDYIESYSQYVILGYYDSGKNSVFGNLGKITINGIDNSVDNFANRLSQLGSTVEQNSENINTINYSLLQEVSERVQGDAALGARIDNIIAPTGDSVAEIVDARVGYSGATYSSLAARLNAESGRIRNVLVVGTGGQYQTITSAINAAQNNDIVFIRIGVYEEQINNYDKCIHIIGESKDEVIWRYPNTDYGHSPYECGMGSIRNLTMHAYDNGDPVTNPYGRAYCIHLDHQSHYVQYPPVSNFFYCENVHFINDNNECLGLGLRNNMTMEFFNCDMETLDGNEATFYVHAASATGAKCILRSCTIKNNSDAGEGTPEMGALRIEGYNNNTGGCTAILERNIIVNLGTGPTVVWQLSKVNQNSWRNVPDWILDRCSLLNNDNDINYSD